MANVTGGSIQWDITADKSKFDAQLVAAGAQAKALGNSLSTVHRDLAGSIQNSLLATGNSFKNMAFNIGGGLRTAIVDIGQDFVDLGRIVLNVGQRIASVAWTSVKVGALAAGAAVGALGVFAIKTASDLQATQISMIGLTKSMELGKEAMAGAFVFAQKSPFQLKDVASTTKSLIAYGLSAKDAVKSLDLLGNVSITSGVPIADLGNIFGRVSAQGKVMLQDIRQLTERGVGILPALQKQLGKTAEEVQDMATNGQISFAQFRQAMESLVDPQILAMLENTLPRQFDRLQGSLRILGFAFIGTGVDAVNGFTAAKDGIYQATVDITRSVADLLRSPAVTAAAAAMGGTIAIGLAEIPKFINTHKPQIDQFFNGIAKFFNDINAVASQKGIGGAFRQLGDGIQAAIDKIDFKKAATNLLDGIANAIMTADYGKYAQALTVGILGIFSSINYVELAAGAVRILIKAVPDIISGVIEGFFEAARNSPMDLAEFLLTLIPIPASVVSKIAEAIGKIPFVGPIAEFILNALKTIVDNITEPIKTAGGKIIGGLFTGIKTGASKLWQLFYDDVLLPIGRFFEPALTWLVQHGKNILTGLIDGVKSMAGSLWAGISEVAGAIGRFFAPAGSWLLERGGAIIGGLANGIKGAVGILWSGISEAASGIGRFFAGAGNWLVGAGRAIIEGLAKGISGAAGAAVGAIRGVIDKVKSFLPGSPAKKGPFSGRGWTPFRGKALVEGFAQGITSAAGSAVAATKGMADNLSSAMNAEGSVAMSMAPSMTGEYGVASNQQSSQYHIGTINIASEVDGERWLQKLTRNQDIVGRGLTPEVKNG